MEIVKKCTGRTHAPFTKFSQMVASSINPVQCHNQEMDISTIHRAHADFMGYGCTHVCMCVQFSAILSRIDTCNQHCHKTPLCQLFIVTPTLPLSIAPGNHWYVLHFETLVVSRMLYKWNNVVYNLLKLALFTQHHSTEIPPGCCVYQQVCPFYC